VSKNNSCHYAGTSLHGKLTKAAPVDHYWQLLTYKWENWNVMKF